jgi:hypothetical protein
MSKDIRGETTISNIPLEKHGYHADPLVNDYVNRPQQQVDQTQPSTVTPQGGANSDSSSSQNNSSNTQSD